MADEISITKVHGCEEVSKPTTHLLVTVDTENGPLVLKVSINAARELMANLARLPPNLGFQAPAAKSWGKRVGVGFTFSATGGEFARPASRIRPASAAFRATAPAEAARKKRVPDGQGRVMGTCQLWLRVAGAQTLKALKMTVG